MQLHSFQIRGLFNRRHIILRPRDNKLVLVGGNGTGKSTTLTILYYFLTRQWARLAEMPFRDVEATFSNGRKARIAIDDIKAVDSSHRTWAYIRKHIGNQRYLELKRELGTNPPGYWVEHFDRISKLATLYDIDADILANAVLMATIDPKRNEVTSNLSRAAEALEEIVDTQVLFLPTYRRIERDLQYIFPGIRVDRDMTSFRRANQQSVGHVELVEFGMKDVEQAFSQAMQRLDREFRADLNRLTGEYLRDVLRGTHTSNANYADQLSQSASSIDAVLSKIDDTILKPEDRRELRRLIMTTIAEKRVPREKEVAAHFLSKLVGIYDRQQKRERHVNLLTTTCNKYFKPTGLSLHFDPVHFELQFMHDGPETLVQPGKRTSHVLPPDSLSSGEKQIASLFTHILLSEPAAANRSRFFVIIDEPELSISVDWQRMLLPDILNTGLCDGLVAVTHSPFIFENEFINFAHSMAEFVQL